MRQLASLDELFAVFTGRGPPQTVARMMERVSVVLHVVDAHGKPHQARYVRFRTFTGERIGAA